MIHQTHVILFVQNQEASRNFYAVVLECDPVLDVSGMTEFRLGESTILGLMPISGITRLLGPALPDPTRGAGVSRSELYLVVEDPISYHARALRAGGREMSPVSLRSWGHEVGYSLDPDGHVLAFATYASTSGV
jgi:uncharacterized protein